MLSLFFRNLQEKNLRKRKNLRKSISVGVFQKYSNPTQTTNISTFDLLQELLRTVPAKVVLEKLSLHIGTFRRWMTQKRVPDNYYNDINHLLCDKYPPRDTFRTKDQFYTTDEVSKYCYKKMLEVLKQLDINPQEYTFIEPAAGCCNFYNLLPQNRRIGIDIDPTGKKADELVKNNYLDYTPPTVKNIVIGNPPFGLRGNLALRFINHSFAFADVVAFILPSLFDSTGKGVPMKRVAGYQLAHSEKLPLRSFQYPDGRPVDVATIFQVWTKVNLDKITIEPKKTCRTIARVYSLSDGGTPASTRNKKMLDKCDVYLPSTCFSGMKAYHSFEELPHRRGYGVVFYKEKETLTNLFYTEIDWEKVAFLSTNSAVNLRTDLIENEIIRHGYHDET